MLKRNLLLGLLMFCCLSLVAQEKGFLTTYSETDHSWFVTDALETTNGGFIISAYDYWGPSSLLLKLSAEGEILVKRNVMAEDTTVYAYRLLQVSEGNGSEYVVLCPSHPHDGSTAALILQHIDEDLNIVSRSTIPCSFFDEGSRFFDAKFLMSDTSIYAALTSRLGDMLNSIFLTKFDLDGNLLGCQKWERDSLSSVCNLFHAEEDKIGLFGRFGPSHMGFLTFDDSLQLLSRDSISQWTNPEGGVGDFCLYHIGDMINSQAAMLPDGSHLVSARLSENLFHANGYSYKNDQSVILAKYENDFHRPDNMLITEHMNDSVEYPAFYRSMDYRETTEMKCEVFQCAILNEFPQYGLLQPYPTGVVVTKTDQDLNVEWKRRFLRDRNYQAMVIKATADGGCLVVGSIGDYQAQRFDVFALKINADGTMGIDEIQEKNVAFVYPNPAKETIRIGGMEVEETQVYNALGQCVMSFCGNEASVSNLSAGVYLLRVFDRESTVRVLRFVVDR
jgi:hypothetical protein